MKFSDGVWLMQKDVKKLHPAQADFIDSRSDSLTILASTRKVLSKEDMYDTSVLTVQFSSPMPDVVRVKVVHFAGVQPKTPAFQIFEQENRSVQVREDAEAAELTSGQLSVRVPTQGPWQVEFRAGERVLTTSPSDGMALVDWKGAETYLLDQLTLGVGEVVYGLGEHFTALVKNGQTVDMWNKDGGTSSEQAYKNIPFYLTDHGYGVFVSDPGPVSFEVATERVKRVQFSVPGECLEYYVIYGPTPKEIIEKYTALTGRPALPPAWSFGLWLTTSWTTDYDEGTVAGIVDEMARRDLPLGVFHFDARWMKEFRLCDLQWDERIFPDPEGMLRRLKQRGLHICVWINPFIAQASRLFEEGVRGGYLLKKPNGDVWQTDQWQPGMGIVDFTNPGARAWFQDRLRDLVKMGVDSFKSDFGERIPTDVVYWDGSDPVKMHNYYTFLYNRTVYELLQQERGLQDAVLFGRSATAGSQQFPVCWGGDNETTFESMAESLRGGLSLTLSGFSYWSHDIGGFGGAPNAAVYKRWVAFGLLSSHSRLHGRDTYRVPWLYDEEAVDVLRKFTKLKLSLMPYLYGLALLARDRGLPVMRAMWLEFPDDPNCTYLDRQYMLGEALLVAPVFSAEKETRCYLPAGTWTDFFTGETCSGPGWFTSEHDFMSLPLWVRPNTVLAVGSRTDRADYDYADGVTLQAYQLQEGARQVIVPNPGGEVAAAFDLVLSGSTLAVRRSGAQEKAWRLVLVGVQAVEDLQGGTAEATPQGVCITAAGARVTLRIAKGEQPDGH